MRLNRVEHENKTNRLGTLGAGVIGAAAGAVVCNVLPVTKSEYDTFIKSQGANVADNMSKAIKASRPLGFFVASGAIIALTGHVLAQAIKSLMPEKEPKKEVKEITMADAILEGLGSNTEIFILTNEAIENKGKKLSANA